MKFYLFYVLLYVLFAFSLGGFLLTHLGHVYHGAPEYEYQVNIYPKIFEYNKVKPYLSGRTIKASYEASFESVFTD